MGWRLLLAFLWVFAIVASASAAVTPNNVITAQTPNNGKQNFIQGTDAAGTYKTVYTAGANGSKCTGLTVSTNDGTAQHVMTFEITNGANTYHYSSFTTALAPTNNTTYATANAISSANWAGLPIDSDGNPYLLLVNGDAVKATFGTALTSTDEIDVLAVCADF